MLDTFAHEQQEWAQKVFDGHSTQQCPLRGRLGWRPHRDAGGITQSVDPSIRSATMYMLSRELLQALLSMGFVLLQNRLRRSFCGGPRAQGC